MASDFGKMLRIQRIKNGEIMADMASKLGVSVAFLSKVENGIANPSEKVVNGVIEKYDLSENEKEQLKLFAQKNVSINVSTLGLDRKKLTMYFAESVSKLNDKQIEQIEQILSNVIK